MLVLVFLDSVTEVWRLIRSKIESAHFRQLCSHDLETITMWFYIYINISYIYMMLYIYNAIYMCVCVCVCTHTYIYIMQYLSVYKELWSGPHPVMWSVWADRMKWMRKLGLGQVKWLPKHCADTKGLGTFRTLVPSPFLQPHNSLENYLQS